MADPDHDHGLVMDEQGRVIILESPFFELHFGNEDNVGDYVNRITYLLALSLEAYIRPNPWIIVGHPPPPPPPATFPRPSPFSLFKPPPTSLFLSNRIIFYYTSPTIVRCSHMADPDHDHGLVMDEQGRVIILESPFFELHFGNEDNVGDYVNRITYLLALSLEAYIRPNPWIIVGHPPPPPPPATFPWAKIVGTIFFVVISILVWNIFSKPSQSSRVISSSR
ncbi:hypothetical protein IEQ34_011431 [Dendrobium chrysotoxum]|uniref:Uncharacterized protein n=1 Tax=Dendrobium chrysotoxum TaxID=161865 RepID=A0AAV7GR92_DENCH|nr:hypothetical protein IEQ34_011431 [Dendrobium chrysotoxum]